MLAPASRHDRRSVSVVIPTRNRARLLDQTLQSVARQSAVAEVIVADDGSTDATQTLLQERGVTSVRNERGGWGAARARNAGLERVTTEYVSFVDSDDLLVPGAIAALQSALAAQPDAPFAFGSALAASRDHRGWRPEGLIRPETSQLPDLTPSIFVRNCVPSSGAVVRTEAARKIGGYDAAIRFVEDHHFWVRLAQVGPPVYVEELVCIHRRHPGNRHNPTLAGPDVAELIRVAEGDPRLSPRIPERLGVELCEASISAVKARRPDLLWNAARDLLLRQSDWGPIIRRSWRHWMERRLWGRAGRALWSGCPELSRWLSSY